MRRIGIFVDARLVRLGRKGIWLWLDGSYAQRDIHEGLAMQVLSTMLDIPQCVLMDGMNINTLQT